MLQNAYFLAKIGAERVENEHHFAQICRHFADVFAEARAAGLEGGLHLRDAPGHGRPAAGSAAEPPSFFSLSRVDFLLLPLLSRFPFERI